MFRKKQSIGMRIWHWMNAAIIFLLLLTVFLRNTFLNVRANKILILEKAHSFGLVLTDSQSADLAKVIRNQVWQWHPIIGFVAIGLLFFRFFIFLKNKSSENISIESKPMMYKIIKKTHTLFYFVLGIMGVTGSLLYWEEALSLTKGMSHNIQEVHEALLWFFVIFTITHIVGVIKAELTSDKGLISDMFNGGN
jgi:cytochrome b561